MSFASTVLNAIAFIPATNALDGIYAQQCLTHVERRGYRLIAVLREWTQVQQILSTCEAQVVVCARREHLDPQRLPRIEIVGDDTQDLVRLQQRAEGNAGPASTRKGGSRSRRPNIIG